MYLIPAALALLSKPPAAAFPLLLFTYVLFFERDSRKPIRDAIVRTIPALVLTIAGLWLRHAMTPKTFAPIATDGKLFLATQPFVIMRFAASARFPVHLDPDSDLPFFRNASFPVLAGFVFLVAFVALAIALARIESLRPAAVFPVSQTENDHRMFFPFEGLFFAIVWLGAAAMERLRRNSPSGVSPQAIAFLILVVLGAYGYGTFQRNRVWHDEVSMWHDVMTKSLITVMRS